MIRDPKLAASGSVEPRDVDEIWLVRSGNGKTELATLDADDQGDDLVSICGLPRSEAIGAWRNVDPDLLWPRHGYVTIWPQDWITVNVVPQRAGS